MASEPVPVDWSTLTADEQETLLLAVDLEVDAGCELLDFTDLSVVEDLSGLLDLSQSNVTWNGKATVHRDCSVTLARELSWGTALIRLFQVLTDAMSGLSARRNVGVFCLTTPDTPLGTEVLLPDGSTSVLYKVTGPDRLHLLDREVGRSYVVTEGTGVLAALEQVITDAGLSGVLIDSTAEAATVPTDMAWPLIPSADTASSTDTVGPPDVTATSGSRATTWLNIANDLLGLISYRGAWCDDDGYYRFTPYADPSTQPPTWGWNADDPIVSTVLVDRTASRDVWKAPNRWIFIWSNMPTDGSGDEQTPTEGNGGVYIVDNVSDGPSSQAARNGLIFPTQVSFNAASADDLIAQGLARVAADKRAVTTYQVKTGPFPIAGHWDVFTYTDEAAGGSVKVQATSWQMPLNGGPVTWDFEEV